MSTSSIRFPTTAAFDMFQDPAHGLFDKEMELPLPTIPVLHGRLVVPHPEEELHRILRDTLAEDAGSYAEPPPRLVSPSSSTPSVTDDSLPPTPSYGPPVNFARVAGPAVVYRSSFPQPANFEHLAQLGLKTILTLVPEAYPAANRDFLRRYGIRHVTVPIPAHKKTGDCVPVAAMADALRVLRDPKNHPLLVHCNKGKHRTGCVVGAWRKTAGWAMADVLQEYRRFAGAKARPLDEAYLGALLFDEGGKPLAQPAVGRTTKDREDGGD